MSRTNKVNPDHYTLAGRLSPDDLARERWKQQESSPRRGRREKPLPPWMRQPATIQAVGPEGAAETSPDATANADADTTPGRRGQAKTEATRPGRPAVPPRATASARKTRARGPAARSSASTRRSSTPKAATKARAKKRLTAAAKKSSAKASARTRAGAAGSIREGAGASRKARTLTEKKPARRKRSKR